MAHLISSTKQLAMINQTVALMPQPCAAVLIRSLAQRRTTAPQPFSHHLSNWFVKVLWVIRDHAKAFEVVAAIVTLSERVVVIQLLSGHFPLWRHIISVLTEG